VNRSNRDDLPQGRSLRVRACVARHLASLPAAKHLRHSLERFRHRQVTDDGEGPRPGTRVTLRVPLAAERVTDPDDAGNLVRGSVPGLDRTRQGSAASGDG